MKQFIPFFLLLIIFKGIENWSRNTFVDQKYFMRQFMILIFLLAGLYAPCQVKLYVHLDTSLHKSMTGRLFLFTLNDTTKEVRSQPDGDNPQGFYAINVSDWTSSKPQLIDDNAEWNGVKLSELKPGYYKAGAVIDVNNEERAFNFSPGNAYSRKDVIFKIDEQHNGTAHIYINNLVGERPFKETSNIKLLKSKSVLLSGFHHKDVWVKAAVILPDSYSTDSLKKYPVVFIIPGWGGTHYDAARGNFVKDRYGIGMGKEKIYVYLNPETQTRWGLHAFVDSHVNGPWGQALVEEVMPVLSTTYRTTGQFFVMGQSSGGYGALWLQLHYPKAFDGAWAVSPDPVDFSSFTGVDLYKDKNVYVSDSGQERPLYSRNGKIVASFRNFVRDEIFFGDGGQMQSFEAEFGKLSSDGKPKLLFDRNTGIIDPNVVKEWEEYDMALYLSRNWKKLSAFLSGKVHVYAGGDDNFQLNKAVRAFKQKATAAGASVMAEEIPDSDHFTIWKPAFTARVQTELDSLIRN